MEKGQERYSNHNLEPLSILKDLNMHVWPLYYELGQRHSGNEERALMYTDQRAVYKEQKSAVYF